MIISTAQQLNEGGATDPAQPVNTIRLELLKKSFILGQHKLIPDLIHSIEPFLHS